MILDKLHAFHFDLLRDETIQNGEESEESEEELLRPENRESPPVAEIDNVDETKVQLVDHNWSFLRTILPDREEIEQQLIDDNLEPTLPSEYIYNLV